MKLLGCGIVWSKKYLFFFMFSISWLINKVIECSMPVLIEKDFNFNYIVFTNFIYCGELLSGLLEIISCQIQRRMGVSIENKISKAECKITILPSSSGRILNKCWYLLLIFASAIDFVSLISIFAVGERKQVDEKIPLATSLIFIQLKFITIIFSSLYSKISLKYPIYWHQKISLVFILIVIAGIITSTLLTSGQRIPIGAITVLIPIHTVMPAKDVLIKWLMEEKGMSAFVIVFVNGCVGAISSIIFIAVVSKYNWLPQFFGNIYGTLIFALSSTYPILLSLVYIVGSLLSSVAMVLINEAFTPMHKTITEAGVPFIIVLFVQVFEELKKKSFEVNIFLINTFGWGVILFFSLLYVEAVILYLCKLDKYTNKGIMNRGDMEIAHIIEISTLADNDRSLSLSNELVQ